MRKLKLLLKALAEREKEIEVKLLNNKGNIVSEHIFIQDGEFIDASTSKDLSLIGK